MRGNEAGEAVVTRERNPWAYRVAAVWAGISVRDTKELWDMPIVFLVLLGLMSTDWLLRRKWGVV